MWTLIGLATARQQLRVGGPLIARVAVRGPARSGVILRRGFAQSSRSAAAAAAPAATTTRRATKTTSTSSSAKPKSKSSAPKKKTAPKKKKPTAKKKVPKKKALKKKVLTPEQKRAHEIRELKHVALLKEGGARKNLPATSWTVYLGEVLAKTPVTSGRLSDWLKDQPRGYKELSAAELERLTATAKRNALENEAARKAWILSHTPQEINAANLARRRLNVLKAFKKPLRLFKDERLPTRPASGYTLFISAQMKNVPGRDPDRMKNAAAEWKKLSKTDMQPYLDNAQVEKTRYEQEVKMVLGRDLFIKKTAA